MDRGERKNIRDTVAKGRLEVATFLIQGIIRAAGERDRVDLSKVGKRFLCSIEYQFQELNSEFRGVGVFNFLWGGR